MPEITAEQLKEIRAAVYSRGVRSIDLELELTDHIATATENAMGGGLSFDKAFATTMNSFGRWGFIRLQREKTKAIAQRGRLLMREKIRDLFSWPGVLITLMVFMLFYTIFRLFEPTIENMHAASLVGAAIGFVFAVLFLIRAYRTKYEEIRSVYGITYAATINPLMLMVPHLINFFEPESIWFYTVLGTSLTILNIASFRVMGQVWKEVHSRSLQLV